MASKAITPQALRYLRQTVSPRSTPLLWCRLSSTAPSTNQTHYSFFPKTLPEGPPPAGHFSIDTRRLRQEFLQLQAQAHPDKFPQEKKAQAEALSSRINDAYKTLSDPLLRAQYLLSLHHGTDVSSDETHKLGGGEGGLGGEDGELLMLAMEAREAIEESESEEELEHVKAENEERIADSVRELERAFEEADVEKAKKETIRLRYWVGIRERIKERH